jgi:hypothetical protein
MSGEDKMCYLKSMHANDHGNTCTMAPIKSEGCTLCLKRRPKANISSHGATTPHVETQGTTAPRTATVLLRLWLTDGADKVAEDNW